MLSLKYETISTILTLVDIQIRIDSVIQDRIILESLIGFFALLFGLYKS